MDIELSKREKLILDIIIEYYIAHAEPLGSRTISKKLDSSLSSATIRNIMADLEEMGLLQHPHTSAGRIPTDRGYRYYVDKLLKTYIPKTNVPNPELESLSQIHERAELMAEITRRLSYLSKYIGIIVAPKITDLRMKHIDFIHLSSDKILVIFIAKTGWVYNKIIEIKDAYSQEELNIVNFFINTECENLNLAEIRKKLMEQVTEGKNIYKTLFENISIISDEIYKKQSEDLYLQGQANIFDQPEFNNLKKIRLFLETMEEKINLVQLLDKCICQNGIKIYIGSENEDPNIQDCSIVMSPYCLDNRIKGALGIIGPTRMRYTEVINLVDNVALVIGRILAEE